jgi:hypothetical protein
MSDSAELTIAADPEPPPAPRPISRVARRRSWAELRVRTWLIATFGMVVVTAFFAGKEYYEAIGQRWLISHGTHVMANLVVIDGARGKGAGPFRRVDRPLLASLEFTPPGGEKVLLMDKYLYQQDPKPGEPNELLYVGQSIPILIDPADPTHFTDRLTPAAWSAQFVATLMLVPTCLVLALISLWQRSRVLALWRSGVAHIATVVSVKAFAAAPRSYRMTLALRDSHDRRTFDVLLPKRFGQTHPGDEWWVISCGPIRGLSRAALLAALYRQD